MALRDPGMLEFARLIDTEELATEFAREHDLLLSDRELNNVGRGIGAVSCALGTPGCTGTVHEATKRPANRNNEYQGCILWLSKLTKKYRISMYKM